MKYINGDSFQFHWIIVLHGCHAGCGWYNINIYLQIYLFISFIYLFYILYLLSGIHCLPAVQSFCMRECPKLSKQLNTKRLAWSARRTAVCESRLQRDQCFHIPLECFLPGPDLAHDPACAPTAMRAYGLISILFTQTNSTGSPVQQLLLEVGRSCCFQIDSHAHARPRSTGT